MRIQSLLGDDSAVSPVIGVILMVAVTVILSAVIAAFVFSAFDNREPAPQVTFGYDYSVESNPGAGDGSLTVTVTGGDVFTASNVEFRGVGLGGNAGSEWQTAAIGSVTGESTVGGGQRAQTDGLSDSFELELVWTADSGDSSTILSTRTGPAA